VVIDSLARAYRWSFDEIMSLTHPQIVMINAACEYNVKRGDEYYEWKKQQDEATEQQAAKNPFVQSVGKRLDEMNTDEILAMTRRAQARIFAPEP
jgi:hypothetical protein